MPQVFYDQDADLEVIRGVKVGIIGYGIQGRAQALNLRACVKRGETRICML